MDDQQQFYTLAFLATYGGAASAVRLFVEYSKSFVGDAWRKATGQEFNTFLYALLVAYFLVYGTGYLTGTLRDGMWFAHIFNGPMVAIVAGAMQKPK
jgi:hypothetical protein